MVLSANNGDIKRRMASKKRLLTTTLLGFISLLIPVTFVFFDPILFFAEYKVRLDNGSMLHGLLSKEFVGPKVYVYLFNVSNADAFMAGRDQKIKLEESGPYCYQEYRTNDDLEINQEPGIMRYTPRLRVEFVPEESVADPKDVQLVMPNIPLLLGVTITAKQSYFVQQVFNLYATSLKSKAFIKASAYDFFWGYPDPLIRLANSAVPGLIYFNSTGLLERLYDKEADYRLELGTTNADKFSVKKATKFKPHTNYKDLVKTIQYFTNTFEGAVYPPDMKPEMPIHIYRPGLCKTFHLKYAGTREMSYGGDGFVYNIHNSTFNDHEQCDSKGWCPSGLKNMAPCYLGLPFALSKGHFLDADPRLLDMFEGLHPDRAYHDIETVVDPKIGITISGSISLQLNLFLADVGTYHVTKKLTDIVIPMSHLQIKTPPMLEETKYALRIMYTKGPYILLAANITCISLGLLLLAYSARLMYFNWMAHSTQFDKNVVSIVKPSQMPLLVNSDHRLLNNEKSKGGNFVCGSHVITRDC